MRAKQWCITGGAIIALSACQMDTAAVGRASAAPRSVSLTAGALIIPAPRGYCIDTDSLQDVTQASFVLMGSCTGLRGRSDPSLKGKTAMLTASVSAPFEAGIQIDPVALGAFFASGTGLRALSRSGNAQNVKLYSSEIQRDILILHAEDSSKNPVRGLANDYWRAIFVLRGRLVTLTASPFAGAPVSETRAKQLLIAFAGDLRARNAGEGL